MKTVVRHQEKCQWVPQITWTSHWGPLDYSNNSQLVFPFWASQSTRECYSTTVQYNIISNKSWGTISTYHSQSTSANNIPITFMHITKPSCFICVRYARSLGSSPHVILSYTIFFNCKMQWSAVRIPIFSVNCKRSPMYQHKIGLKTQRRNSPFITSFFSHPRISFLRHWSNWDTPHAKMTSPDLIFINL